MGLISLLSKIFKAQLSSVYFIYILTFKDYNIKQASSLKCNFSQIILLL